MILFKKSKFLYVSLCCIGLVVIFFFMNIYIFHQNLILCFISFIFWVFISAIIGNRYAIKINNDIFKILTQECNPPKYINIMETAMKGKRIGAYKTGVLLNLSTAYLNLEHKDAAKLILDTIGSRFPNTRLGAVNSVCYYHNMFYFYLYKNDLQKAEDALHAMKLCSENIKAKKFRKSNDMAYTYNLCRLNMAKGQYEGSEQIIQDIFDRAKGMYAIVTYKLLLGQIYQHEGRTDEAKAAFEYVIEHGNKLYKVQEAKQCLQQL